MGIVVSSSHAVSAGPSSSGLLILFHCSSTGSLLWETVLHKLVQREAIPWDAVLQERTASVWVAHGVTSPASKPASAWAPLSMGPQVLPGACSGMGFRGHCLLQASICSIVGSSMGYRWRSALLWTSTDCRGTACLTLVFTISCRGISALVP